MTDRHARALRRLAGDGSGAGGSGDGTDGRVRLYRTFDPAAPAVDPTGGDAYRLDIDDPWYGDREDFETCLAQVEAGADGVVAFVGSELARRRQ